MLVVVCGLPGSGKSYFAIRLAEMMKAVYINSDTVRNEVVDEKTYSEMEKQNVYEEMKKRMMKAIKQNRNAVLDATFYKKDIRNNFRKSVEPHNTIFFIEVIANESIIEKRVLKKRTGSDADHEVYTKIKQQWEPLEETHLVLKSTNDNIDSLLQQAAGYLQIQT